MKKYCYAKPMIAFALGLLLLVPIHYRFISLGKKVFLGQSQLYEYKNEIGSPIYFKTSLEIEVLRRDYEEITRPFQSKGKIYFISKDKAFIETLTGKNIQPKVYDIYSNYKHINKELALQKLQDDFVTYLVLDTPSRRFFSQAHARHFQNEVSQNERVPVSQISTKIDDIERSLKLNLLKCNDNYCIYKI